MEYFVGATRHNARPPQPRLSSQGGLPYREWSELTDNFFICSLFIFCVFFLCSIRTLMLGSRVVRGLVNQVRTVA
jgi:hypothetical protein